MPEQERRVVPLLPLTYTDENGDVHPRRRAKRRQAAGVDDFAAWIDDTYCDAALVDTEQEGSDDA